MFVLLIAALLLCKVDYQSTSTNVGGPSARQVKPTSHKMGPSVGPRERDVQFTAPIENVTAPLGREAILSCSVADIGNYKLAWIRADDQTILSLDTRLVTHSARFAVSREGFSWRLHIRPLRRDDRGCYMCQLNTSTMKNQIGCVDVLEPPNIIDEGTSNDVDVREGENVTLTCKAEGRPAPRMLWRREDGANMLLINQHGDQNKVDIVGGSELPITSVSRLHTGAYLCIASNDVPPSVSKRIMLTVNFAPEVILGSKLSGTLSGGQAKFECIVEAQPPPVSYWLRDRDQVIYNSDKHKVTELRWSLYQWRILLVVADVSEQDEGIYTCVATNSMGRAESTLRLYEIKTSTTTAATTTSTATEVTTTTTTTATTTTTTTDYEYNDALTSWTTMIQLPLAKYAVTAPKPAEPRLYTGPSDVTIHDTLPNALEPVLGNHRYSNIEAESGGVGGANSPIVAFRISLYIIVIYLM